VKKITSLVLIGVMSLSMSACRPRAGAPGQQAGRDPAGNEFGTRQGQIVGFETPAPGVGAGMEGPGGAGGAGGAGGPAGAGVDQGIGIGDPNRTGIGQGVGEGAGVGQGAGFGQGVGIGMEGQGGAVPAPGAPGGAGVGLRPGNRFVEGRAQGVPAAIYRDGTYTGEGDRRQDGNEGATVVIRNGQIVDIQLRRVDAQGREIKDENVNARNPQGGGFTANMGQTKQDIRNAMIQAQTNEITTSTTGDNDVVRNWKRAVGRALDQARR
jgi:uncharacterized protein with FMN-binding domain